MLYYVVYDNRVTGRKALKYTPDPVSPEVARSMLRRFKLEFIGKGKPHIGYQRARIIDQKGEELRT